MEREKFSIDVEEDQPAGAPKIHRFMTSSSYTPFFSLSAAFTKQDGAAVGAESENSSTTTQKEHMFDKVVTPSDVGKLNRLVIPKQHAENYFALDASANEKGLLLCFEDSDGKAWRFRYSYWKSSQSYVMTKGWSRFVKDKRLNAGDTVSFSRGIGKTCRDRFYIDWKRRPDRICDPLRLQRISVLPRLGLLPFTQPWMSRPINHVSSSATGAAMYTTHDRQAHASYGYGNVVRERNSERRHLNYLGRPPPALPREPWTALQDQGCSGGGHSPGVRNTVSFVHNLRPDSKKVRIFGVDLGYPDQSQIVHASRSNYDLQAAVTTDQLHLPPPPPSALPITFQASSNGAAESSNI